jgi:hypothetical protein
MARDVISETGEQTASEEFADWRKIITLLAWAINQKILFSPVPLVYAFHL